MGTKGEIVTHWLAMQMLQVQDGYPTSYVTANYQALCVAWDPATRLPKRNTSDIYPAQGSTTALGNGSFQFQFYSPITNVATGDYITARPSPFFKPPLLCMRCLSWPPQPADARGIILHVA
jgi:hypothetical protein